MSMFREVLHTVDKVRNRKKKQRKPISTAVKGWVLGGVLSAAGTVAVWALAFLLVCAGLMFLLNMMTAPLNWLSAGWDAVTGSSEEQEDLDEAREDFQGAADEGDPVLQCLLSIPEVTAVNEALYVGDVPDEVTTTVAGPDGSAVTTTAPIPNSELISDEDPIVDPGSQVIDAEGSPTDAIDGVVDTIPDDTHAVIARAYLVTALAGGTTGFEHFEAVASRALDGEPVTADNAVSIAQAFFPTGTDLRPYYRVADALVFRGIEDGVISNEDGEGDFVYDRLAECDGGTTDTTG